MGAGAFASPIISIDFISLCIAISSCENDLYNPSIGCLLVTNKIFLVSNELIFPVYLQNRSTLSLSTLEIDLLQIICTPSSISLFWING